MFACSRDSIKVVAWRTMAYCSTACVGRATPVHEPEIIILDAGGANRPESKKVTTNGVQWSACEPGTPRSVVRLTRLVTKEDRYDANLHASQPGLQ
jgi:hypothetical protein